MSTNRTPGRSASKASETASRSRSALGVALASEIERAWERFGFSDRECAESAPHKTNGAKAANADNNRDEPIPSPADGAGALVVDRIVDDVAGHRVSWSRVRGGVVGHLLSLLVGL